MSLRVSGTDILDDRAVRDRLVAIWRRILRCDQVHDDSDWYDLRGGLRSPLLFDAIRAEFGVCLPVPVLYRDSRLADLADTVRRGTVPDSIRQVIPLRSGSRLPALAYVPGVFGEDLHALGQLRALANQVYFLRAPGLDEGEEPLRTLPDLARFYLDHLLPVIGATPVLLAGFSAGGTIAVEMARLGAERGWAPLGVVLIDTLGGIRAGFDDLDDEDLMAFRLQTLLDREAQVTGAEPPQCLGMALDDAMIAEVTAYFHDHDAGELPRGVPWPHLERRLRVYATGMRAASAHKSSAPCDVPIYYLRTDEGREFDVGWESATTTGSYEVLEVNCTHSSLWYDDVVTGALTHFIEAASGGRGDACAQMGHAAVVRADGGGG